MVNELQASMLHYSVWKGIIEVVPIPKCVCFSVRELECGISPALKSGLSVNIQLKPNTQ